MPDALRLLPLLALAAGLSPQLAAAGPVALHCDRLFDARSGRVLGEHTIVSRTAASSRCCRAAPSWPRAWSR